MSMAVSRTPLTTPLQARTASSELQHLTSVMHASTEELVNAVQCFGLSSPRAPRRTLGGSVEDVDKNKLDRAQLSQRWALQSERG